MKIEIETNFKKEKKLIEYLEKKNIKFSIIENDDPNNSDVEIIDFKSKKTEYEWNLLIANKTLTQVPKWFEFIGWLFLLGALNYIQQSTGNIYVNIVYVLSHFLLNLFLFFYFIRFEFQGFPLLKSKKYNLSYLFF